MLLKDFYTVTDRTEVPVDPNAAGNSSHQMFTLELHPGHGIYHGHFPGSPVVPGVCQIQLIKELIEDVHATPVKLEHADNIKFLSLIVPGKSGLLVFDVSSRETEPGKISANVTIRSGSTVFLKFKGIFSRS